MAGEHEVASPLVKVSTAWGAVAAAKTEAVQSALTISSWTDVASMVAAVYTACLFGEFLWKKVIRPFAESRGWVKRRMRRSDDVQPTGDSE